MNTTTTIAQKEQAPVVLRKRIVSITYEVAVRFSDTSRETMEDKLLRLAEREVKKIA
jgi:hypothetical protein